jgi:hypothetical protein
MPSASPDAVAELVTPARLRGRVPELVATLVVIPVDRAERTGKPERVKPTHLDPGLAEADPESRGRLAAAGGIVPNDVTLEVVEQRRRLDPELGT